MTTLKPAILSRPFLRESNITLLGVFYRYIVRLNADRKLHFSVFYLNETGMAL